MTHAERLAYIRIILGSPSTDILPDAPIELFLNRWELYFDVANTPENEPYVLYNTVISTLQWLIAFASSHGDTYTERTEKIGQELITIKGGSQLQAWMDLLKYIEVNPEYVDARLKNGLEHLIIVGGVRKDEYARVKRDPNSIGPYNEPGVIPSTQPILSPENGLVYRGWPRGVL